MSKYDDALLTINSRIGEQKSTSDKKSFVDRDKIMEKTKEYSLQVVTFVVVLVLLLVLKPGFVMKSVSLKNGGIEKKLCFMKVILWTIIATIVVTGTVFLYKSKMVEQKVL